MPQTRVWTPESIAEWQDNRDKRRAQSSLKPMNQLSAADKEKALDEERTTLLDSEWGRVKSQAWPLGQYPVKPAVLAPFSGVLVLPKHYRASDGFERKRISEGDDLNMVVYDYYEEAVDVSYGAENFVSTSGIKNRRHEYLGPSPEVAGFQFNTNEVEVEWYESHLDQTWIGKQSWAVEVEFDPVVEGWFLIDRNDY